jgi:membrane-associated phospholipid phosphatase
LTLADAAILCWDCKYHYALWRPVTAIRQADLTGNRDTEADPDWTSLVPTPPFPTYTSGHSSFSSAAATVLANFFGTDAIAFSSRSDVLPGVVRRYPSFSTAAKEAGLSRIYGGIHFDFDNEAGLASGRALGEYVTSHYLLPQPATATDPLNPAFSLRRQ